MDPQAQAVENRGWDQLWDWDQIHTYAILMTYDDHGEGLTVQVGCVSYIADLTANSSSRVAEQRCTISHACLLRPGQARIWSGIRYTAYTEDRQHIGSAAS